MASELHWTAGDHPSPEQLLLAREDELPRAEAEPILAHVHQCWECRARVERYQRAIGAYVEFRKLHMDPAAAPTPGAWLRMAARLRGVPSEPAGGAAAVFRGIPRSVWFAFPAMAAAALALVLILSPARLTATVVFDRAMRAETTGQGHLTKRRVSVRRKGQLVAVDDVVLRTAYIDHAEPLSVRSFRRWHDGLRSKIDSVASAGDEIRVETRTEEGAISLARLMVARADYVPRAKHVELRDGVVIDVEAIEGASTAPEMTNEPIASPGPEKARASDSGIDRGQRESIEMEVRWALQRIDADLGEALTIQASGDELVVAGTLDDGARRDQIVTALAGLPHVSAHLRLADPSQTLPANAQPVAPAEPASKETGGPLLASQLRVNLPDPESRREFVSAAIDVSGRMLRHAWALKRLAQRYTVTAESRLPAEVRGSLERLVLAHKKEAESAAREAATLWQPYAQLDGVASHSRTGWQQTSDEALRSAQAFDHLTARLLAATGNDGLTAAAALARLRESQRQLMAALGEAKQRP